MISIKLNQALERGSVSCLANNACKYLLIGSTSVSAVKSHLCQKSKVNCPSFPRPAGFLLVLHARWKIAPFSPSLSVKPPPHPLAPPGGQLTGSTDSNCHDPFQKLRTLYCSSFSIPAVWCESCGYWGRHLLTSRPRRVFRQWSSTGEVRGHWTRPPALGCVCVGKILVSVCWTLMLQSHVAAGAPPSSLHSVQHLIITTSATVLRPLYRSTCVSQHLQLRNWRILLVKVLLPVCLCWRPPAHS